MVSCEKKLECHWTKKSALPLRLLIETLDLNELDHPIQSNFDPIPAANMGGEHDTYSRAEFYCSTKRTADFANKSVHRTSQRGLYAVEPTNIYMPFDSPTWIRIIISCGVCTPQKTIRTCLGIQQTNSTISHLGPDFPSLHKGGVFFFRFSLWKSEIWGQQCWETEEFGILAAFLLIFGSLWPGPRLHFFIEIGDTTVRSRLVDLGKHSGVFGHLARVKKERVDNHTPFIQSFTMFFFWGGY